MKVVVFLGPTLPLEEARSILDATYLPPAGQSDILSAIAAHRPDIIGLIDGVFHQSLSVWHKEILFAISGGIRVFGAASMGAIRAAECGPYGMVGIGQVFRQFASGELEDDDEVAVAQGPPHQGYRAASEAMVNIRATLRAAVDAGAIDRILESRVAEAAKAMYFPRRSFSALFESLERSGLRDLEPLKRFVRERYVDVKANDARLMLTEIARSGSTPPESGAREFPGSTYFDVLFDTDRRVPAGAGDVDLGTVLRNAAISDPDFDSIVAQARGRRLAVVLASVLGIKPSGEELAAMAGELKAMLNLTEDAALAEWRDDNDLSEAEFQQVVFSLACARRIHLWLKIVDRGTWAGDVLDQMRLAGRYVESKQKAMTADRLARAADPDYERASTDLPFEDLVSEQANSTGWRPRPILESWAHEAGFDDFEDLYITLLRAHLARGRVASVARSIARSTATLERA